MKGKELLVTNSDLVMKREERLLKLFLIFKDLKYGTKYLIFTDTNKKELFYGNPLVNGNKMVVMKFKNIKDAENVKEFVWKYVNNESVSNFELIEIPEIDKLEVIDNNVLDVKEEYIEKLDEMFFKEEIIESNEQVIENSKKKSKAPALILILFLILLGGGAFYLYNNPELIYGKNIYVECNINYGISELNADVKENVVLTFNNSQILKKHERVINYTFTNSDSFYEFKEKNLQYQYINESGLEKFDDDTLSYRLLIDYNLNNNYQLPKDYNELYDYYKNNNYSCSNVEK